MPYPVGWPPKPVQGIGRNARFFVSGVATAIFDDRAYLFIDDPSANTNVPTPVFAPDTAVSTIQSPMGTGQAAVDSNVTLGTSQAKPTLWARYLRVYHDSPGGADLEITFTTGDVIQAVVKPGQTWECRDRYEAGIAVRGLGVAFRIEAW